MKKVISIVLMLALVLSLCACGGNVSSNADPVVEPTVDPTIEPTSEPSPSVPIEVDPTVFADWEGTRDDIAGTAELFQKNVDESTYLYEPLFTWKMSDGEDTISNSYQMPFYVNDENEKLFIGTKVVYDEGANIPYKMLIGFLYFIGADASDYTYQFIVKTENQRFAPEAYYKQHGHLSHDGWTPNREDYKYDPNTTYIENAASGGIYLTAETEELFKDIKDNPDKDVIVRFGLSNANVSVNGTPPTITKTIDVSLSQEQKEFLIEMYDCYILAHLNIQ